MTPPLDDAVTYWVENAGVAGDRVELARGLLACGMAFIARLRDMADRDDDWLDALDDAWALAVDWLRGTRLSTRPDEDELRAQLAHDLLTPRSSGERSEVIAVNVLLSLPTDHPLRDPGVGLRVLRRGRQRSRRAGDVDGELEAITYLLRHGASERRVAVRLDRRGQDLAPHASPAIAEIYWLSRSGYHARMALLSADAPARRGWADEALASVARVAADGDQPASSFLLVRAMATEAVGDRAAAAELYERAATALAEDGADLDALVSAGLLYSAVGATPAAVELLRQALPRLVHEYAFASAADEVEHAGAQLARVAGALAFEECAAGRWSAGLTAVDQAKSLRLRHQLVLRRSADVHELRRLDQLTFAMRRGAGWVYVGVDGTDLDGEHLPYRTEYWLAPEVRLRLAVREQRAAVGPAPGPVDSFHAVKRLGVDEAVLVLGIAQRGTIVAVLTRNDVERPSAGWVTTEWPASRWAALAADVPGPSGRPAIGPMLDALDSLLGVRVAEALDGKGIRRLHVVPHLWLHGVPFHAVPSLAGFEVVQLPSLSGLTGPVDSPAALDEEPVVVGNPTGDLALAGLEALVVAEHLASAGMTSVVRRESEATRDEVRRPGCTLLHFAGHGRSNPTDPERAALLLCHRVASEQLAKGLDPLAEMAGEVDDWVEVGEHTREKVIRSLGTLRETRRNDTVERVFEHTRFLTVLIRQTGGAAVAADLWSAGEITAGGDLARCQLAVLTACDAAAGIGGPDLLDESAGLPAALLLAGVGTVVAPLRPIADDVGLLFADRFYAVLAGQEPDETGRVDVAKATRAAQRWLAGLSARQAVAELRGLRDRTTDQSIRDRLHIAMRERAIRPKPYADPEVWATMVVIGSGMVAWPRHGPPR